MATFLLPSTQQRRCIEAAADPALIECGRRRPIMEVR